MSLRKESYRDAESISPTLPDSLAYEFVKLPTFLPRDKDFAVYRWRNNKPFAFLPGPEGRERLPTHLAQLSPRLLVSKTLIAC